MKLKTLITKLAVLRLKRSTLHSIAICYLGLWMLTSTVGEANVDSHFASQFLGRFTGMPGPPSPIYRDYDFDIQGFRNQLEIGTENEIGESGGFSYSRKRGIAIAPFIIVDEVEWSKAPMDCCGKKRLVFWFFGLTWDLTLELYWIA